MLAMRSRAGVGMTPPKVLGAAKPTSSVMISRMLGASPGGTVRGDHHGLDWVALRFISPPKGIAGDGRTSPLIVRVAAGEPGTPLICWALAGVPMATSRDRVASASALALFMPILPIIGHVLAAGALDQGA